MSYLNTSNTRPILNFQRTCLSAHLEFLPADIFPPYTRLHPVRKRFPCFHFPMKHCLFNGLIKPCQSFFSVLENTARNIDIYSIPLRLSYQHDVPHHCNTATFPLTFMECNGQYLYNRFVSTTRKLLTCSAVTVYHIRDTLFFYCRIFLLFLNG